jgi:predicted dehydrogenase
MTSPLGYGLIGCGGFGRFCLAEYQKMNELRCVAVADLNVDLAQTTAAQSGIEYCPTPEALLVRPDIDIVHLATPPFTHAPLALLALQAGKHVLCEKPLALELEDAREMASIARKTERLLAVNLIMRYNPLCLAVKHIVERGILGVPLFASLTNSAQDETLGPGHWFWEREQSGGIFIEHGVHFFDLFEWWFGEGVVLSAHQVFRSGTDFVDQVQCTVRYGSTLGTFYHGFHQMLRRDRQHWQIIFETGTLTMSEWVPTRLDLDFHGTDATLGALQEILPHAELKILERYTEGRCIAASRHKQRDITVHATLSATAGLPKMDLYGEIIRALMADQLRAIADPHHPRTISESNGVSSLAYAARAQEMAERQAPESSSG